MFTIKAILVVTIKLEKLAVVGGEVATGIE